jgi:hypothetical protein
MKAKRQENATNNQVAADAQIAPIFLYSANCLTCTLLTPWLSCFAQASNSIGAFLQSLLENGPTRPFRQCRGAGPATSGARCSDGRYQTSDSRGGGAGFLP